MSEIKPPACSEDIGEFFGIRYVRHSGRFVGTTSAGPFSVPYEIARPVNEAQAVGVCLFEPLHAFGGPVAREEIFGRLFLFSGGVTHATVQHRRHGREDDEILREFAIALRHTRPVTGPVSHIYAIGFSNSGNAVLRSYRPFGHKLFDITFACTTAYKEEHSAPVNIPGQKPIILFDTERDFNPKVIEYVARNASFPQYRWYTVAGAPHIPDTALTRKVFTDPPKPRSPAPPVAGTTPINWVLFIRALLVVGDQWVREGRQPPPSVTLRMMPGDPTQLDIDSMGNALGGIRHPALETREATFVASQALGAWNFFGGYANLVRIQDYMGFDGYFRQFRDAVESAFAARFLRRQDADKLLKQAQLNRENTFTRNYAAGLFVP